MNNEAGSSGIDSVDVDLTDILRALWQAKYMIAALAIMGLLAGLLWLQIATPRYTTTMQLTPAPNSNSGSIARLGGLGGLAAAAGFGGLNANGPDDFDLFFEMARSRMVADSLATDPLIMRTIFEDQYDSVAGAWKKPEGALASGRNVARSLLGRGREWVPPTGRELQLYIHKTLNVVRETNSDPVTYMSFDSKNPAFGPYFLQKLFDNADEAVRQRSLHTSLNYIAYLEKRLPEVQVVEQRQALAAILSEQEKAVMIARSDLPFSAQMLEKPAPSRDPSKPNPLNTLVVATGLGVISGAAIALRRMGRE